MFKKRMIEMREILLILLLILFQVGIVYGETSQDKKDIHEINERLIRIEERIIRIEERMATKEELGKVKEDLAEVRGRVEVIGYIALGIFATALFTLIGLVYALFKYPKPGEIESSVKAIEEKGKRLEITLELEKEKRISLERLIDELKRQIPKGVL